MVCQACGSTIETEIRFCPRCGAQIAAQPNAQAGPTPPAYVASPPYPPQMLIPRVQRHLQTLGILWCVFGVYRVLSGLIGMFFLRAFVSRRFGGGWPFDHWAGMHGPHWMAFVPVIATIMVVMASLALIAGYGLLTRRPWARVLAIIIGVLALFRFPLGTALGIYTLWVLAPAASGMEYDAIADHS